MISIIHEGCSKHIQLLLHRLQKWQTILLVHHLALTPFFDFRILSVKIPIQYTELAEIGDIRRFHNGKALIAFAGIDPPPYESGQFVATNRRITKRGSSHLRKVGYEVMRSIKAHPNPDDSVYQYIVKKESEGKAKKAAKIAGLNKFLRIYYARVNELYSSE